MSATVEHGTNDEVAAVRAEARRRAEADDLIGARALLEDAVAVGELRLGRDHPRLVPLIVDLASIAQEVGNLTEALTQLQRAYGIVVVASGAEHAFTLTVQDRLAQIAHRLGDPTDDHDAHLLTIGPRVLGEEHAIVQRARQRSSSHPTTHPVGDPAPHPASAPHPAAVQPTFDQPSSRPDQGERDEFAAAGMTEPGYAPTYVASPSAPGVYDRLPAPYLPPAPPPADPQPSVPRIPVIDARIIDSRASTGRAPMSGMRQRGTSKPQAAGGRPATRADRASRSSPATADVPIMGHPARRGRGTAALISLLAVTLLAGLAVIYFVSDPTRRSASTSVPSATAGTDQTDLTGEATRPAPTPPSPDAPPPTRLALTDNGGSVTLTWLDPGDGRTPFIVAGGRVGAASQPFETVPAGRTMSTVYGLNSHYDYCFTVTAIYSTSVTAASSRVCTHRLSTGSTS